MGVRVGSAGRQAWFGPLSDSGPATALDGRQRFCTSEGIRPVRLLEINIGTVAYRAMWGYGVDPPSDTGLSQVRALKSAAIGGDDTALTLEVIVRPLLRSTSASCSQRATLSRLRPVGGGESTTSARIPSSPEAARRPPGSPEVPWSSPWARPGSPETELCSTRGHDSERVGWDDQALLIERSRLSWWRQPRR